jgi:hypothetical protein
VFGRGTHADARGATHVLDRVYRPLPAAPLAVRCMCMAVVPGPISFAVLSTQVSTVGLRLRLLVPRPMPAAVASRCCRRRLQQLACA